MLFFTWYIYSVLVYARNIHKIGRIQIIIFSYIAAYSTASTSQAAYIIGGLHTPDIIAEFKHDSWRQVGTLARGRSWHGSIGLGDDIMVIGGWSGTLWSSDGRLVYFYDFLIIDFLSEKETEIWNFTNQTNKVVNPILPNSDYIRGIGLYIVPFNFCST